MEPHLSFIVNPNAGSGKGKQYGEHLIAELTARGIKASVSYTRGVGDGIRLASSVTPDTTHVIAVGGDGTINEVVNGIAGKEVVFGLIPCGTGNDFMKMVGMSPSVHDAVDQLLRFSVRNVDLGVVKTNHADRFFINNIGIGFDAVVAAKANRLKYLGLLSYLYSVVTTLVTYKEPMIRLKTNDREMEISLFLMTFGNGTHAGGVFKLTPHALVDDGVFHTTLISGVRKMRVFDIFPKVIKGTHLNEPEISSFTSEGGSIISPAELTIHVDGEVIDTRATQIDIGILAGKQRVLFGK